LLTGFAIFVVQRGAMRVLHCNVQTSGRLHVVRRAKSAACAIVLDRSATRTARDNDDRAVVRRPPASAADANYIDGRGEQGVLASAMPMDSFPQRIASLQL
jgi:hypothetical protein